jgi:hypothetical protein
VKSSSGASACSAIRRRPLVSKACTLHNACTVRQKWRPKCTRGSVWQLKI